MESNFFSCYDNSKTIKTERSKKKSEIYSTEQDDREPDYKIRAIVAVHTVALVFWLFLIVGMMLCSRNIAGIFILFIPIIASVLGIINAPYLSEKVEKDLFTTNFLSLGIIVVIPLLAWVSKDDGVDSRRFATIGILAVILSLASYVDFWVPEEYIFLVIHIQGILRTFSIVLIIYALFSYYEIQPRHAFT